MKAGVILVNYEGEVDTLQCLDSLRAQQGVEMCVIVVDNSSSDTLSRHADAYPEMRLLRQNGNIGFAAGSNVGIRHALSTNCDNIFLLNNDTMLEPDCLVQLLACSQRHPDAAIVTPAIYQAPEHERPWFTGSSLDWPTFAATHTTSDVRTQEIAAPFPIPWATGCAMLIPAPAMRALSGFDERFFCYYEDVDLSLRAVQLGYSCLLCPDSVLYHKVGASVKKYRQIQSYYDTRNRLLCCAIHTSGTTRKAAEHSLRRDALKTARRAVFKGKRPEDRRRAVAIVMGMLDFHLQRFGECRYNFL